MDHESKKITSADTDGGPSHQEASAAKPNLKQAQTE